MKKLLITTTFLFVACNGGQTEEPTPKERPEPIEEVLDCSEPTVQPAAEAPMRLLTRYEFDFTVRDLFGVNANHARETFPVENASNGFESTFEHAISDNMLRKVLDAAEAIAPEAAVRWDQEALPLWELLNLAFRRPATADEVQYFGRFFSNSELAFEPNRAKEMTISAILLSPQFLYRVEFEDQGDLRDAGVRVQNSSYEMASRLSYFLWGSMPDEALFAAAEADELQTEEQIEAQVARMLNDQKARDLVHEFYRQYLGLNALETATRDTTLFPTFDRGLVDDYIESSRRFFEEAHFGGDGGSIETLLTSDKLFLTPDLARALGEENKEVVSKPGERAGLLTHPALMMLLAYPDQTSPIHRGIFVRERILCQELPPPPNNITIKPPDFDPTVSTRERFEQLTEADFCTSCHVRIDPLGFGFENYDPIGRFRAEDAGKAVDGSGSLAFTQDPTISGSFDGAVELAQKLGDAPEVKACIAEQWFRFAQGKRPDEGDYCEVRATVDQFAESPGSFADLMVAITTSDTFRHRLLQGGTE